VLSQVQFNPATIKKLSGVGQERFTMKTFYRVLLVLTVLCIALPLYAQNGCDDSPEDPTAILALVGAAGAFLSVARSRWTARNRK
jgi:XrtJ-associated TM-motif-TM protein